MTRVDIPNKTGDYVIDGVSIIILPEKIIVDTGQGKRHEHPDTYTPRESKTKKEPPKKKDWLNDILDNAEDLVMGRKKA